MTNGSLMKVKSIAECSPWSILQYFLPELSDNWFWQHSFSLFESGRFTQVLLYGKIVCLIWFFTSHQQSFSYERMGLPGLNQYMYLD